MASDPDLCVAINPATVSGVLEELVQDLDQVVVMTVNPGFGHQPFLRTTLPKIGRVRELVDRSILGARWK